MKKNILILILFVLFFNIHSISSSDITDKSNSINLPELTGRVVDQTLTLSENEKSTLESLLTKYETSTGNQMAVAFINTTGEFTIEEYSIKLAEKWKIGFKSKDNGIIILVAKNDKKMRIEVGYGLEGEVTDLQCNLIINNIMKPYFRQNDFFSGIKGAIIGIGKLTGVDFQNESDNMPNIRNETRKSQPNAITIFIIIIVIIFSIINFINRSRRGYSIRGRRSRNIFFGGGGFGGFGGSGKSSGGGGFSGGGGSFGGGGSSGSW